MYGNQWGSFVAACSVCRIFTTSHVRIRKSRVLHLNINEIEIKIIITIVQSYTEKNITFELPLALLLVLPTSNNTDGNKLVIFYSITSYYGDNYILQVMRTHGKFMSEKLHA